MSNRKRTAVSAATIAPACVGGLPVTASQRPAEAASTLATLASRQHHAPKVERLLSSADVLALLGKGRTWMHEAINTGGLPKPRKFGRRLAWPQHEIANWIAALPH